MKTSKNKNKEKYSVEKYQFALEQVRYEGQLLWQIFGSFLLTHTVFLAFLLHSALGKEQIIGYHPGSFFAAIIGILLCIPWAASYLRSSAYYTFRIGSGQRS